MTEQRTSEVLNLAADLIEERGWVQGQNGWPGYGYGSALCLEGGIMAALGHEFRGDNFNITEFWDCPAYQAVERYTGTPRESCPPLENLGRLWRFNDADERTQAEVIETLRAAALVEAAREDAALLAEVGAP